MWMNIGFVNFAPFRQPYRGIMNFSLAGGASNVTVKNALIDALSIKSRDTALYSTWQHAIILCVATGCTHSEDLEQQIFWRR